jgi:hypothetical protein
MIKTKLLNGRVIYSPSRSKQLISDNALITILVIIAFLIVSFQLNDYINKYL